MLMLDVTQLSDNDADLSTQELLEILHASDTSHEARENAMETVYRRYAAMVLTYIRTKVNQQEDVWDIHSEVWKFAFERLRRFTWQTDTKTTDPLKAWLLAIAHHKILEYQRRHPFDPLELIEARLSYMDTYDTLNGFEVEYPGLHPGQFQSHADRLLVTALRGLNPIERKVIQLTYYDGRSSQEIGELLNLSPVNVRVHRNRAIKKMRSLLVDQRLQSNEVKR